jgi:hypothetical protein
MPSNSSPIAIPSYRKVLLDQMKNSRIIWSFDPSDFELKPFHWYVCRIDYRAGLKLKHKGRPVDGNKRVTPDMWLEYRAQHKFQGPHCLCPLIRTTDQKPPFTEANILLERSGDHIGEYIAECPNRRCDYFGQFPVPSPDKESLTIRKISSLGTKVCIIWHTFEDLCSER